MIYDQSDLDKLLRQLQGRSGKIFNLREFCYTQQYSFVVDPNPYANAVTTRRSGKTTGIAALHIDTALKSKCVSLYITQTRANAKKLMWPILLDLIEKYRLIVKVNVADLTITFPNGSIIYLDGVNDSRRIENFRGMKIALVTIDEGQSMRAYIETLIDDILAPALLDSDGMMRVVGTPGPIPSGYFYKISQSKAWSRHFFSMFDNPHIKNAKARLEVELARRGVTIDHPSVRREYFGEWVTDFDALVIKYNEAINNYDDLPSVGGKWQHIISIDLGYDDSDAIAIIAFNYRSLKSYLIKELVIPKQGITPLTNQIQDFYDKYKPIAIKMDTGGLGKKIAEEITQRTGLPITAAEKNRKFEYIELLNDALRTGRFMAKANSRFAEDAKLLEWDREIKGEKKEISENFHSDIIDAVLYGFRESLHWASEEEKETFKVGTPEFYQQIEDMHEKFAEKAMQESFFEEKN